MTEEIWMPMQGFEQTHLVSNLGRIKSLSRKVRCIRNGVDCFRMKRDRILKPHVAKHGYELIKLSHQAKKNLRDLVITKNQLFLIA